MAEIEEFPTFIMSPMQSSRGVVHALVQKNSTRLAGVITMSTQKKNLAISLKVPA